jgi:hypothetical protein
MGWQLGGAFDPFWYATVPEPSREYGHRDRLVAIAV